MLMVDFGNRSRESATAEAEPAVKRALALDSKLAESQAAWGLIELYNDRFEESAEALRRATALRPGYAQAHMWLGRLFVLHNEIRRAAAAFDRAYELEPQSPMVGLNLGMALDTEGRYDIAAKVLQETIAHNPKLANAYWAYAQLEWDRGELGAAADAYRSAIELGADYTELYANYAVLLSDMGDMDGAARALTNVALPRMNEPAVWAARAAIAANSGRYQEFLDYAAASRGGNDDLWATLAEAKVELARGHSQRALNIYVHGRIEQRMSDGELAREIKFLGGPSALLDLACAHELSGNAAHADQLIQRAEAMIAADRERGINPSHYDYLLAAAASMRGDQTRAIALIRVANERGWQRFAWFKIDPRFAHLGDREGVLAALVNRKDKIAEVKREVPL
jgi:tetratricopeptide (TPR) repeat protein